MTAENGGGQRGGDQPPPGALAVRVAGEERNHRDSGHREQHQDPEPAGGAQVEEQRGHRVRVRHGVARRSAPTPVADWVRVGSGLPGMLSAGAAQRGGQHVLPAAAMTTAA